MLGDSLVQRPSGQARKRVGYLLLFSLPLPRCPAFSGLCTTPHPWALLVGNAEEAGSHDNGPHHAILSLSVCRRET